MTILESLRRHARERPRALAFSVGGESISYGQLHDEVLRLAGALQARGLARGERCALMLGTCGDFVRALFAVQTLGAIPVAMNTTLPPPALSRRLALVRPALALTPDEIAELRRAPRRDPDAPLVGSGELAFLQITSGTTGEPRAAAISHRNLVASLAAARARLEAGPDDILVGWVPLHHDLGLVRFVFATVYLGARAHLLAPSLANLADWLRTITRVRATVTGSPDFGYRIAARSVPSAGIDLGSLRFATNGGEPVRLSTIRDFEERFGCRGAIRPGYGLAEATLGVSALGRGEPLRSDATGAVSTGRAFDGMEIRVTSGSIEVRGEAVFAGYFGDPEATGAVLAADGWLKTGDIGALDADGHLYVHGRTRAMIKRAGALVAPFEAEQAVDRVPGVRLSAAVGVAREASGGTEDVVIVAELAPEQAASEAARRAVTAGIVAAVTDAIGFAPGEVVLVPARTIPLTANGKIRHAALKELLGHGAIATLERTATGRSPAG